MRAIACLLVLCSHCNGLLNIPSGGIGAIGVEIFIVLSGFLVEVHFQDSDVPILKQAHTYTKKKLCKFYWLHVLTMLIALTQYFVGWVVETPELNEVKDCAIKVIVNLLLVQSWIPDSSYYFSLNGVSWYLSTSIVLYFSAPFLHRCIQKINSTKQKNYLILGVFALQIVIAQRMAGSEYLHAIIYIHPLVRIFDFITGMLLGSIYKNSKDGFRLAHRDWLEKVSLVSLAGTILLFPKVPEAFSYVVLSAPTAWLLICSFTQDKGAFSRLLSSSVPTFIGDISFEIFMVHRLVISYWEYVQWISRRIMHKDILGSISVVCVFAISVAAAQVLHTAKIKMDRYIKDVVKHAN